MHLFAFCEAQGFGIWGFWELDSCDFSEISRAMQDLAKLEDFFISGRRVDALHRLSSSSKDVYASTWLLGSKRAVFIENRGKKSVHQSRSRQASFSYTAHHLAVYEKRQVTQNLFISTQCQGGSGKRKCSFTMSRLNIRDLIEQRRSSLFRPGYKKRDTTQYCISLFYCPISWCGMLFMVVFAEFSNCNRL